MSPLRAQMHADMVIRGLSASTREAYISAVVGLARHYKQSPAELSQEQVQQYLLHLIEHRRLAWSTTNQAACALRFLFHFTLKQPEATFDIPLRLVPAKLPEILSREEVDRILCACLNFRHQVLLTVIYACGLRVAEACALKVSDIDSERMMLRVTNGKGGKDRYTLLSPQLLALLRRYWIAYRPTDWLFPKTDASRFIDISQVQKIYYAAKRRTLLGKHGGIHALRHAFATHLLESGVDIHTIGQLMGHDNIGTTARYLHMRAQVVETGSPLDLLAKLAPKAKPATHKKTGHH